MTWVRETIAGDRLRRLEQMIKIMFSIQRWRFVQEQSNIQSVWFFGGNENTNRIAKMKPNLHKVSRRKSRPKKKKEFQRVTKPGSLG